MVPRYLAAGRSPALAVNAWALAPAAKTVPRIDGGALFGVKCSGLVGHESGDGLRQQGQQVLAPKEPAIPSVATNGGNPS